MKKNFILFIFLLCSIVAVAQKKSINGCCGRGRYWCQYCGSRDNEWYGL